LRGAEIFACQLSLELQNAGHHVDVLVLFGNESTVFDFPLSFHYLKANEKKRWWDFKGYKKLQRFINEGKYDIVQANAGDTLKYASLSKKFFGWNSKLFFRNANKIGDFLNTPAKRLLNRWVMKEVDYVASVSNECMNDFVLCFPGFDNKIKCLPIGVSVENITPYDNLEEIGIYGSGPFLLHVAGFVPEKNHSGLINIFSKLLSAFPNAKLLLIGEGRLKAEIQQKVKDLQLESKVHFLGKRNDVQQIMGCCDVFVLPSLIEGLPGVILEAFVNKLPVVAYNVGGIKEIVINNKTGWLVEKNNESGFVNSLKICLQNSPEKIIEEAYQLTTKEYSIKEIAKKFLSFYKTSI
jgi:glycosyltransferase involved in cell wall biosynthesis